VSGHGILVFDFFTAEKVADLKGHNNKVRSLFWLEGGDELLSSGQDGAIYLWDVMGNRRITNREFIKKSVFYTSVVYSGVNGSIFAVGSDRLLKELSASDFTLLKDIDGGGYLLNQIALSHSKKALLVSTGEPFKPGGIRVFNYPLLTSDYTEYPCTSSAISRMCITPDENFAVVADESGCE
jgi:WD40 repeat protein